MTDINPHQSKGYIAACAAFIMWGFFPVYWNWLAGVDAITIVMHRIVWSFFFVLLIVVQRGRVGALFQALKDPKTALLSVVSAMTISLNWGVFIWAVANDYTIEASLGYYINPLLSVLLGVVFFKESLSFKTGIAVVIAAVGVLYLILSSYGLPWVALSVATSFAFYGVLKKITKLSAADGLFLESGILLFPALAFIVYSFDNHAAIYTFKHTVLLTLGGLVTLLPLLAFSYAASRIPLSSLGMLQYIGPSIQLVVGVVLLNEIWSTDLKICFSFIWTALIIYSGQQLSSLRFKNRTS